MPERLLGGRYRLVKKVLAGESAHGVPELWIAQDGGDTYFAKVWKRSKDDAGAIQALWNREVRSLSRLQGYPGAAQLFTRLFDLGADEKSFFAILEGGRTTLLSILLKERQRHNWLTNLGEVGRRRPIWEGLLRVAEALAILHSDGTLHRSLSSASIFSSPDSASDFRLSGFEWSLRIASSLGAAAKVGQRYTVRAPELDSSEAEYSMATDWFDFGLLAAEVFGVSVGSQKKREGVRSAVENLNQLGKSERQALLHFLEEKVEDRVSSAEAATQLLRNIVRDLNLTLAGAGRRLTLALRLNPDTEFARTVSRSLSAGRAETNPASLRSLIEHDLRGDPRVISRVSPQPHYVLKGEKLEYRVRPWEVDGIRTWDVAFCDSLEPKPRATSEDQFFSFGERRLDLILYPEARKTIRRLRDLSANWQTLFPFRQSRAKSPSHLRNVHDFFRVTQQLETLLTAAQICPVRVVALDQTVQETVVALTPLEESDRNNLAQVLKLPRPSEQIIDWFDYGNETLSREDEDPKRDQYQLLDRRAIKHDTTSDAVWTHLHTKKLPGGIQYFFRSHSNARVRLDGIYYLARNYGGTIAQIRRRHRAIEELATHEDLLRVLADPRGASRRTTDELPSERQNIPLDPSKVDALRKLWRTQPFFTIQGPPGTGKTTLIEAFADRLLSQDATAQILVTAHAHHTVDDVLGKLRGRFKNLAETAKPILIRLGVRDGSGNDVASATKEVLSALQSSPILAAAPDYLRKRTVDASRAVDNGGESAADFRTMQLLVQDAANITFATSNAADLEEISLRGRRFDWSVIEEAGKAHGFDMAAALQASHRLLLIGDHFQLPPFNAGIFKDLLAQPLRVRNAISLGVQFAPGLIDPSLVEEEEGRDSFEDRCNQWRRMVDLFAVLFESSHDADNEDAPAARLTDQHRMHPDIAELVGKIFYPDDEGGTVLNSPEETHKRFAVPPPYTIRPGGVLPPERVVWRDVPWVQRTEFSQGETDGLFSSVPEAEAVVEILRDICPTEEKCEIQILSPYNDQLQLIRKHIESAKDRGELAHMFREPLDLRKEKRMGATVDEFQGSEADIVIVSLVRNNGLPPWKSVGFLKEANRMNVLLSRAKQKLIIVGSWRFFASRCSDSTSPNEQYAYMKQMMAVLSDLEKNRKLARFPEIR